MIYEAQIDEIGITTRQAAQKLGLNYSTFRTLIAKLRDKPLPGMKLKQRDAMPPETFQMIERIVHYKYQGNYLWDTAINTVRNQLWENFEP